MITPEQLAKSGTEHGEQCALFCWSSFPEVREKYPQLKYLFAVPNGFFSNPAQKAKMKAEGLKDGVPDVWLPVKSKPYIVGLETDMYSGLIIEMKILARRNHKNGGASDEQLDYIAFLKQQGYQCHICYGWEEARDRIIEYLK